MDADKQIEILLSQITSNRFRMELGMANAMMLINPESHQYCKGIIDFGFQQAIYCDDLILTLFKTEESKWYWIHSLIQTSLTASLTTCYELIKSQCKDFGEECTALFKSQKWFHFARMIRNSLSHDYHISYSNNDHKYLPIGFLKWKLTLDMDGKPLSDDIFPPACALWLLRHMEVFVARDLAKQFDLEYKLTR